MPRSPRPRIAGHGQVAYSFSLADKAADFLAAGETLKVVYNVTVSDGQDGTSTQPITFTLTGTNDAPVLSADAIANHAVAETGASPAPRRPTRCRARSTSWTWTSPTPIS